jgi:hypothetical protein
MSTVTEETAGLANPARRNSKGLPPAVRNWRLKYQGSTNPRMVKRPKTMVGQDRFIAESPLFFREPILY